MDEKKQETTTEANPQEDKEAEQQYDIEIDTSKPQKDESESAESEASYYSEEAEDEQEDEPQGDSIFENMSPDEFAKKLLDAADLGYIKNLDKIIKPVIKETK